MDLDLLGWQYNKRGHKCKEEANHQLARCSQTVMVPETSAPYPDPSTVWTVLSYLGAFVTGAATPFWWLMAIKSRQDKIVAALEAHIRDHDNLVRGVMYDPHDRSRL